MLTGSRLVGLGSGRKICYQHPEPQFSIAQKKGHPVDGPDS